MTTVVAILDPTCLAGLNNCQGTEYTEANNSHPTISYLLSVRGKRDGWCGVYRRIPLLSEHVDPMTL
jgi:hypothetical protein